VSWGLCEGAIDISAYLLLRSWLINVLDAIGLCVTHLGVALIRTAVRLDGSSWSGFSLLDQLSIVPVTISVGAMQSNCLAYLRNSFSSSSLNASSSRLPDLWIL
jgi:hypothetical protein